MTKQNPLLLLTLGYAVIFVFSAVSPTSHAVWIAEIIPAVAILATIIWLSRRFTFAPLTY